MKWSAMAPLCAILSLLANTSLAARQSKVLVARAELRRAKTVVVHERELQLGISDPKMIRRIVATMSYKTKRRCRCRTAFFLDFELRDGRHAAISVAAHYWTFDADSVVRRANGLPETLAKLMQPVRLRLALAGLAAKDGNRRRQAVSNLGHLGPHAAPAVPVLVELLEGDPVIELRAYVASTLALIDKPRRAVDKALERAAKSPQVKVRDAAREALQLIAAERKAPRR